MAEPLKTFFSAARVRQIASDIVRVMPDFPERRFVSAATRGLDDLALLDRAKHIKDALAAHLPASYPDAVDVLMRALGPEHATDELMGVGMAPFIYLPHVLFVAERGLDHFEISMHAQRELTKRFSAEFSIRHFIAHDPQATFAQLTAWTRDPHPHVRRLVSEGTRLRLPWAMRVPWLDQHPDRVISLLEALKDDPTTLVRRSVANNLNDLGKVHPELLTATCAAWLKGASDVRRQLVEHALRSAVKRGDSRALALLGYGGKPGVVVESVKFTPKRVAIGGRVEIAFVLRSTARGPQQVLVDLAVHFVKAGGRTGKKVFKLKRVELPAKGEVALQTFVSLAVHTTRVPRPGRHEVEALLNGVAFPLGAFDVTPHLPPSA